MKIKMKIKRNYSYNRGEGNVKSKAYQRFYGKHISIWCTIIEPVELSLHKSLRETDRLKPFKLKNVFEWTYKDLSLLIICYTDINVLS